MQGFRLDCESGPDAFGKGSVSTFISLSDEALDREASLATRKKSDSEFDMIARCS